MHRTGKPWSWQEVSHVLTLTVYLQRTGGYVASLTSATPGEPIKAHVALSPGDVGGLLAPPGLEALAAAAKDALDRWWAGELG